MIQSNCRLYNWYRVSNLAKHADQRAGKATLVKGYIIKLNNLHLEERVYSMVVCIDRRRCIAQIDFYLYLQTI